jgi:hypothetical protein
MFKILPQQEQLCDYTFSYFVTRFYHFSPPYIFIPFGVETAHLSVSSLYSVKQASINRCTAYRLQSTILYAVLLIAQNIYFSFYAYKQLLHFRSLIAD